MADFNGVDFLRLDDLLTDEERLARDTVREFVSKEFLPLIQEHVRKVTAPYKYPRAIEYVTELPKTISGKIRRVELRQAELNRARRASD